MSNQRHVVRLAVYGLCKKDDKYLFIRRAGTGYRDGEYTLPAGHVEANETFTQTCIREMQEEVGIAVNPQQLHLAHVMQRHEGKEDYVDYYFVCQAWEGEPAIGEPHKADDLQWFTLAEAADKAIPFVHTALQHIRAGVLHSYEGIGEASQDSGR